MSSKIGSSSNNRSADSSLSNSFNVSGSPHQSKDATSRKGGPVSGIWSDLLNNVSSGIAGDANTSNSPDPNVSADEGMLNSGDDSQDAEGIAAHMNKYKGKHILVIGDASSGKTTLLSMLRGGSGEKNSQKGNRALVKSGYALDYYYVDIHSEELDIEETRKCSIWVLRGSSGVQSLLQSSYCAQMVPNTLFTIVLDYSSPWRLKLSLQNGIESIQSIIAKLQISEDILAPMKKKLERRFQLYFDNEQEAKQVAPSSQEDLLPLGDGILSENLGVPILIVCSKLDSLAELEKTYKYNDEHFDYIQQFLRTQCLKYGASLVYSSSKDTRYSSTLYKMILNSLYHVLPKTGSLASVVEKDCVAVPIGWDGLLKIKTVQDNLIGDVKVDQEFDHVLKSQSHTTSKRTGNQQELTGTPLMADEEQVFLNRSQSVLQKPVQTTGYGTPKQVPGGASPIIRSQNPGNTPEQNLSTFFNSLLNSKKGATPGAGTASGLNTPMKMANGETRRMSTSSTPPKPPMTPKMAANAVPPAVSTTNGSAAS